MQEADLTCADFQHKFCDNYHEFQRPQTTAKNIAEFRIGQDAVRRAAEFAQAVEVIRAKAPQVAERILLGQVPDALTELPKLARKPELLDAVAQKLAQGKAMKIKEAVAKAKTEAREKRLKEREAAARKVDAPAWRLLHGDLLEAGREIQDCSVHAVITDPPYGRQYLALYDYLSILAARVLVPGGVCLVMTGQANLREVITRLEAHLHYVWVLAYLTPGHSTQVFGRRIKSNWKPVLYFSKGPTA